MKKAVYLQFTNPGAYPPLIHSSNILLAEGWQVLFLGVEPRGESRNIKMPEKRGREVRMLKWVEPGFFQKLHYLRFVLWSLWVCVRTHADIIYCSDPFATLPGILLRKIGFRVIYHEHDSPDPGEDGKLPAPVVWGRRKLLCEASLVIFPNELRLARAQKWSGSSALAMVVWNCPSMEELSMKDTKTEQFKEANVLRVYYHGTIVPNRLPLTILDGIARCSSRVELSMVGYTTVGHPYYDVMIKEHAGKLGIKDQSHDLGVLTRKEVIAESRRHDVGLVLFTGKKWFTYASEMAGASNKPFDYLSQGLAVIVPDNPEWRSLFVDNGCAVAVNVDDPGSLAELFDQLAAHPEKIRDMGRKGRVLIEQEWNYEKQFQPVLDWIING